MAFYCSLAHIGGAAVGSACNVAIQRYAVRSAAVPMSCLGARAASISSAAARSSALSACTARPAAMSALPIVDVRFASSSSGKPLVPGRSEVRSSYGHSVRLTMKEELGLMTDNASDGESAFSASASEDENPRDLRKTHREPAPRSKPMDALDAVRRSPPPIPADEFDDLSPSEGDDDEEYVDTLASSSSKTSPVKKTGGAGDAKGGKRGSGDEDRPLCNEQIRAAEVRVIDSDNKNLGIVPTRDGIKVARAKGLDLVLTVATATPPVCRIVSLRDVMAAKARQTAELRKKSKMNEPKEMRFTARTGDHDLGIKAAKMIEFLKEGRHVKVSISLTLNSWLAEEPARREVMAKLVRLISASGSGFCDANSIQSAGANLNALFMHTDKPKMAADIDKTLAKLAVPSDLPGDDARFRNIGASVAAAVDGVASGATIHELLPPTHILETFRSGKNRKRIAKDEAEDTDAGRDLKRLAGFDDGMMEAGFLNVRHTSAKNKQAKKGGKKY